MEVSEWDGERGKMSEGLRRYLGLEKRLEGELDPEEEHSILDQMDEVWLGLRDEEQEWLNSRGSGTPVLKNGGRKNP